MLEVEYLREISEITIIKKNNRLIPIIKLAREEAQKDLQNGFIIGTMYGR